MTTALAANEARLDPVVDIATVLSPEYFGKEQELIFRRAWLPIAHSRDIPKAGDFIVRDLPGLQLSLLVVRETDDTIRVFHNTCRHRGHRLVSEAQGRRQRFACNFHGWSYALNGELRSVTDADQFENLDKSCLGLVAVHAEIWETLIFINLSEKPRLSLAEWLGELYGQYRGYSDFFGPAPLMRAEVACNWNLGVNAFTENYHTLFLHRHTVPDYQGTPENPLRHLPAMQLMERHARFSTPANPFHQPRPAEALAYRHTTPAIPTFVQDLAGLPPGVNFRKISNWAFDVIYLFPNFVFLTGNKWGVELWFWPLGPDRMIFEAAVCIDEPKTNSARIGQEFLFTLNREVICEDLSTLEKQHASLKTGAVSHFFLSEQEIVLSHHYRVSRAMIAEEEKQPGNRA